MVVDASRRECGCVVWMHTSGKRKKKKKHLLMGLPRMCTQTHRHVDDHTGVWTWMCCVWMWMWMSIKEKEEKKTYFVDVDGGRGHVAC